MAGRDEGRNQAGVAQEKIAEKFEQAVGPEPHPVRIACKHSRPYPISGDGPPIQWLRNSSTHFSKIN